MKNNLFTLVILLKKNKIHDINIIGVNDMKNASQNEIELKALVNKLETIIESANDGLILLDENKQFIENVYA
jgi:hypothetical protein